MFPTRTIKLLASLLLISVGGCAWYSRTPSKCIQLETRPACGPVQLTQSEPVCVPCVSESISNSSSPLRLDESTLNSDRIVQLSLQHCIELALSSSKIMRDLGGSVIRSPQLANSSLDPALVYTNPINGEEAALSEFDANFFVRNFYEKNDRGLNNQFFGNNGEFKQDLNTTESGLSKRSATGGFFTFRNVTAYDRNNQLSNRPSSPFDSWETYLEAEIRQPLFQGGGTEFNRLAGPGARPGQLNGVLLARVRSDLSLIDFEQSVRDLVADVENAYWDLYYAYRDLEAKIDVRDIARETLRLQDPNATSRGNIAQAQEQVYRFEADVINALKGRPIDATRTNNGSSPGTFRGEGQGGLRIAERRLRLITGMPINDGRLIKPSDEPASAPVIYDWDSSLAEAMDRRAELRLQKWRIKQREMELIANQNFLKPNLDVIGTYRSRGFGGELGGTDSALSSLYDGQFQEWRVGLEYLAPIGFRRGHAAVQNSRLALAREVELLNEQERYISFGLSNAISECERAFDIRNVQMKRLEAIVVQLNAIEAKGAQGEKAELDVRLETHRRLLDARLRFHGAEVDYALALRNVNFEKGSLLEYCNVFLSEALAPAAAYQDATQRRNKMTSRSASHRDVVVGRNDVGSAAKHPSATITH